MKKRVGGGILGADNTAKPAKINSIKVAHRGPAVTCQDATTQPSGRTVMRRTFLSWLAAILIWIGSFLPFVYGQAGTPTGETKDRSPPALQYTVAALSTILILLILCMPSRKRTNV